MPFIDKTPLNYKPNTASSIRRFQLDRAPTSSDYRNFQLGDEWLDTASNDWWKLCEKTKTFGTWRKMAGTASAIETVTGDIGGAVPPDGINNLNLVGAGGITVTGNPGTNTLSIDGSAVNQQQVIYVGKHGNDANDGLSIETAKLTFGNAITTASGISPAAIVCFDDGNYTENITLQTNVHIFASSAVLTGTIVGVDDSSVKFRSQVIATGLVGVSKPAGTSYFFVEIDDVFANGTAIAALGTAAFINYTWKRMTIENGFGIGDITTVLAHMHIKGGDIYINGTGSAIARANAGSTVGRLDHILDIGGGNGIAFNMISGTFDITVSRIDTVNIGVNATGGTHNISVRELNATTAYNLGPTATLNLFVNSLTGAEIVAAGGIRRMSRMDGISFRDPIEITQESGDPFIRFDINQVDKFSYGVDDTDADSLKITDGADPSSGNTVWKMTSAGERTMPLQPLFKAGLTNNLGNITGDSTVYNFNAVAFTENHDIGNNFDATTGIFTAPVTGFYLFVCAIDLTGLAAAHTTAIGELITTLRNYLLWEINGANARTAANSYQMRISVIADMTAGNTAFLRTIVSGGALVVGAGQTSTAFQGVLLT